MTSPTRWTLGTRLALLAAFAVGSLVLATFVAWRLARTTDAFAVRQAEADVQSAAAQLARHLHQFPSGRTSLQDAAGDDRAEGRRGGPPPPPHERQAFEMFSDPLSRTTAIALHPLGKVSGGFARVDGALAGYVNAERAGTPAGAQPTADDSAAIRSILGDAHTRQAPVVRSIGRRDGVTLVAAFPLTPEDVEASGLAAAVALEPVQSMSAATDPINLAAAAGLVGGFGVVVAFALFTFRDLRRGVQAIEQGLTVWTARDEPMPVPATPELARIAVAINAVAVESSVRRARELTLERELHQQERLAALGRVVAAVAHEVRNPLAAMKLKAQMAERAGYAADRFRTTTRVIVEEIDRLDNLVRRLLELGRPQMVRRRPVDLGRLLQDRLALMRERLTDHQVALVADVSGAPVMIEADPERLSQVFDNVIQNALDAMPAGGRLTVSCAVSVSGPLRAVVAIADTGSGVAADDRGRVFEPFYSRRDGGTGLGLAIAQEIVDAHGGRIVIADGSSGGATFRMEFPLGGVPA